MPKESLLLLDFDLMLTTRSKLRACQESSVHDCQSGQYLDKNNSTLHIRDGKGWEERQNPNFLRWLQLSKSQFSRASGSQCGGHRFDLLILIMRSRLKANWQCCLDWSWSVLEQRERVRLEKSAMLLRKLVDVGI